MILVDHTFVFTPAVRKIRQLVADGELGRIFYFDSVRVNLGLFQEDVNVAFDLAVHDLSIMQNVLGELPVAVSATGIANLSGRQENVAFLTCFFDSPLIAHVHVNWLAPVKVRRTLVGGDRKMIVYDDLEPSEKIKVYDKGITMNPEVPEGYEPRIDYRTGDMWAPHLEQKEALRTGVEHFVACVDGGLRPISGADEGLHVVQVLEAANASLRLMGQPVELKSRVALTA